MHLTNSSPLEGVTVIASGELTTLHDSLQCYMIAYYVTPRTSVVVHQGFPDTNKIFAQRSVSRHLRCRPESDCCCKTAGVKLVPELLVVCKMMLRSYRPGVRKQIRQER